jgi:uncharacterized membrane protein YphA (DoxX/SURF4 family)
MNSITKKEAAPIVIRIAMSLVFLWFSWQQFSDATAWVGLIPAWLTNLTGMAATTIVKLNATFELIFGLALLAGYFTRTVAILLALHLLTIVIDLGYNGIAVRDVGLMFAMVSVFLYGADRWSLDARLASKKASAEPQM